MTRLTPPSPELLQEPYPSIDHVGYGKRALRRKATPRAQGWIACLLAFLGGVSAAACKSDTQNPPVSMAEERPDAGCRPGTLGCACVAPSQCDSDLLCLLGRCLAPEDATPATGGPMLPPRPPRPRLPTVDAGVQVFGDAATPPDTQFPDAGAEPLDAATVTDAASTLPGGG